MHSDVSPERRAFIYERYKGCCCYCGRRLKRSEATIDHHVPRAMGGGSDIRNLRLACSKCNGEKADDSPINWPMVPPSPSRVDVRDELLRRCAPRGVR